MGNQKCLEDVPPDKVFRFRSGAIARNLYELLAQIQGMSKAEFEEHSNKEKDDFINWITLVVRDSHLSSALKNIHSKEEYEKRITKRLAFLEKTAWLRCVRKNLLFRVSHLCDDKAIVFALLVLLFVSQGLVFALYLGIDRRLSSIEQTSAELKENDVWIYGQLVQGFMQLQNQGLPPNTESPKELDEYIYSGRTYAPSDLLSEEQIYVYQDRIVVSLENATLARFLDTDSMIPTLDEGANSIEIPLSSPDSISVGDIIIYEHQELDGPVIHRVVTIGEDESGWYAITKGDNNKLVDPYKVRFSQIKRILVGVIY